MTDTVYWTSDADGQAIKPGACYRKARSAGEAMLVMARSVVAPSGFEHAGTMVGEQPDQLHNFAEQPHAGELKAVADAIGIDATDLLVVNPGAHPEHGWRVRCRAPILVPIFEKQERRP